MASRWDEEVGEWCIDIETALGGPAASGYIANLHEPDVAFLDMEWVHSLESWVVLE